MTPRDKHNLLLCELLSEHCVFEMHRNTPLYRRSKQSSAFGVSTHMLTLGDVFQPPGSNTRPLVWKAVGTLINVELGNNGPGAWTSLYGAATLAQVLTDYGSHLPKTLTPVQRKAMAIGELVATWTDGGKLPGLREINQARQECERLLKACEIPLNMVTNVVSSAIEDLRHDDGLTIAGDEVRDILVAPNYITIANLVPRNKVIWYQRRLNILDRAIFDQPSDEFTAFMDSMDALNNGNPVEYNGNIPALNVNNWTQYWRALTDSQRLGFIEMWAITKSRDTREFIAVAVICAVIALLKNDSITEIWLQSRLTRIRALAPDLNIDTYLTQELLEQFVLRYPKDDLTPDIMYKMLLALYSSYAEDKIDAIKWIIEQGVVHNIATAVAFAEAVIKPSYVPFMKLFEALPQNQYAALMTLVMHLKYDRFAAIVKPPITMSEYADLAYIGDYITFQDRGTTNSSYRGKPLARATKTKMELELIANSLLAGGMKLTKEAFSTEGVAKSAMPDHEIVDIEGDLFAIPKGNMDEATEEGQKAMRAGWPRQARGLPKGTTPLDHATIMKALSGTKEPKAKAFKRFMEDLISISNQSVLESIPLKQISSVERRLKLTDEDIADLTVWNVPIPPEYKIQPKPIPVQNSADGDDYSFFVFARFIDPNAPAPGQASPGGQTPPVSPPPLLSQGQLARILQPLQIPAGGYQFAVTPGTGLIAASPQGSSGQASPTLSPSAQGATGGGSPI